MSLFSRVAILLDAKAGRAAALILAAALCLLFSMSLSKLAENPFETDLLSLLPGRLDDTIPAELEADFLAKLRSAESDRATILLAFRKKSTQVTDGSDVSGQGSPLTEADRIAARHAVLAFTDELSRDALFEEASPFEKPAAGAKRPQQPLIPTPPAAAGNLVLPSDLKMLEAASKNPKVAEQRMLACLLRADSPKLLGFTNDPFCLYDRWLLAKTVALPYSQETADGKTFIRVKTKDADEVADLLLMKPQAGVAESGEGKLTARIREAEAMLEHNLAQDAPGLSIQTVAAGVPLFTDAIAAEASGELTRIGTVASIGVALLALLAFGNISTVLFMVLSVALGFAAAVALSLTLFGRLALVTFVFGTTLIGVAVDYSTHWFALKRRDEGPFERRRRLLASLLMAGGSSAAAYGVLALTPLPGLQQMAALAAGGVLATLLIVLVFGPFVERFAPKRETRILRFLERKLAHLPRLEKKNLQRPVVLGVILLFTAAVGFGLSKVRLEAGIRDLSAAPPSLVAAQATLQKALQLPSPAQAFFVAGKDLDEALERETKLRAQLATMAETHPEMKGLTASGLSAWLPSSKTQAETRKLVKAAIAAGAPAIEARLGAAPAGPADEPITLEALKATPLAPLISHYVLRDTASAMGSAAEDSENLKGANANEGAALMTMLSGVTPAMIPTLHAIANEEAGVRFLDITGSLETTLSDYRTRIFELLGAGLFVLWGILTLRFGRGGWRAVLPSVIGILCAIAFFGWTGTPVTLFTALATVLLMGLGVDYGIFLSGNPDDGRTSAAVFFCGLTTMLSFGLLALSSTPALSSFGITIAVGLAVIWVATPLLRPRPAEKKPV